MRHLLPTVIVLIALLSGASAAAQPRPRKTIVLEEIQICCQIQRPQASVVIAQARPRTLPADTPAEIVKLVQRVEREGASLLPTAIKTLESHPAFEARSVLLAQYRLDLAVEAELQEQDGTALRTAAVADLESWLTRSPTSPLADMGLYLLAITRMELGRDEEAAATLRKLLTEWPSSPLATESWVRLGDVHFDRLELDKAAEAYSHGVVDRTSPHCGTALYKLAWTRYRQDRTGEAATTFLELLRWYALTGQSPDLRAEAIQYIAIIMADPLTPDPSDAPADAPTRRLAALLPLDHPFAGPILAEMAKILIDLTRYDMAAHTLLQHMAFHPLAAEAPEVSRAFIQVFQTTRQTTQLVRALETHLQRFAAREPWAVAHKGEPERVEAALADRLSLTRLLGRVMLMEAHALLDLDPPDFASARHHIANARGWLSTVPDDEERRRLLEAADALELRMTKAPGGR